MGRGAAPAKTGADPPLRENSLREIGPTAGGLSRYVSRGVSRAPVAPPSCSFRNPERDKLANCSDQCHSGRLAASAMLSSLVIIRRATVELRIKEPCAERPFFDTLI